MVSYVAEETGNAIKILLEAIKEREEQETQMREYDRMMQKIEKDEEIAKALDDLNRKLRRFMDSIADQFIGLEDILKEIIDAIVITVSLDSEEYEPELCIEASSTGIVAPTVVRMLIPP